MRLQQQIAGISYALRAYRMEKAPVPRIQVPHPRLQRDAVRQETQNETPPLPHNFPKTRHDGARISSCARTCNPANRVCDGGRP
jgi:hypothetical protein